MSGSYQDIKVWQRAMQLVIDIYFCTRSFPRDEMYGLVGQLRRAAVSVPSNIAEGKVVPTKNFYCFFTMPADQSSEVETQLTIAGMLGYIPETEVRRLKNSGGEIARMLNGLIKARSSSEGKQVA